MAGWLGKRRKDLRAASMPEYAVHSLPQAPSGLLHSDIVLVDVEAASPHAGCKVHAVAYSTIAWRQAWLEVHDPLEETAVAA